MSRAFHTGARHDLSSPTHARRHAVRNLSPLTQTSYVGHVSLFARHFRTSPALLGPEDIRAYQVYLATERRLATSSVSVAVAGLRISEAMHLTLPAIDSQRMVLRVEQGKGQKDCVMLSPRLLTLLRDWWRVSRSRPWLFRQSAGATDHHPLRRQGLPEGPSALRYSQADHAPLLRHAFAVHLLDESRLAKSDISRLK